ncbi:hypothetical protein D7X96_10480 [Corallococcus interemptor]|uniref:J domain-containing protein n=1 Tax=Corallococcus interemptor TaxID=2316720 RepID=A0A3A8QST2_9BACT|nr:hypothetical protein D7Y23_09145 [Corallococcus sp. AB050B]RKH70808.1 hypothetical protein D7X96_10480 [Corallococcus interemptor]
MDFQEALRELDVEADPGGDVIRRAYLRKLKTRKPETDPEGFARLREAYETVLARREGREAPRTQAAPLEEAAKPAPESGPTSPVVATPASLERFRAEFRALPPDAPPEAPVDVARRAVEALQDEVEPRQWLVEALLAADRVPEALAAYRDAYRQGHLGFLAELAQRFPRALEDAEISLLGRSAPHRFLWMVANRLLELDEVAHAWKVGQAAFERMGNNPEEPPPPPGWFVQFVLLLHLNVLPGPARELAQRYVAWVKAEGLSDAFASEEVAPLWPLVLELNALPDTFSGTLRRTLAKVVLDGHVERARAAFLALAKVRPEEATDAVHLLRQHAPLLYLALDRPAPPEARKDRRGERRRKETGPSPKAGDASPAAQAPSLPAPKAASAAPEPVADPWGPKGASRGFKVALGVLGVVALLVVALVVQNLRSRPDVGSRVPGQERVEAARQAAFGLCVQFSILDRSKGCNYLQSVVKLGDQGDCKALYDERIALRTRLENQLAVFGAKDDPTLRDRQRKMDEAFTAFEQALGRICQR